MSIFLCVKCGTFHDTKGGMNTCNHKKEIPKQKEVIVISDAPSAKEVREVAEKLNIPYESKTKTLPFVLKALENR